MGKPQKVTTGHEKAVPAKIKANELRLWSSSLGDEAILIMLFGKPLFCIIHVTPLKWNCNLKALCQNQ